MTYNARSPADYYMQRQQGQREQFMNLLNLYLQKQQIGRQQKQQEWENQMAQKKFELAQKEGEAHIGAQSALEYSRLHPTVKLPEFVQVAELLLKYPEDTPQGKALREAKGIKSSEDEFRWFQKRESFKAGLKNTGDKIYDYYNAPEYKHDATKLSNIIKRYASMKKTKETLLSKTSETLPIKVVKRLPDIQKEYDNLDKTMKVLYRVEQALDSGVPLNKDYKKFLNDIAQNPQDVMNGKFTSFGNLIDSAQRTNVPKTSAPTTQKPIRTLTDVLTLIPQEDLTRLREEGYDDTTIAQAYIEMMQSEKK